MNTHSCSNEQAKSTTQTAAITQKAYYTHTHTHIQAHTHAHTDTRAHIHTCTRSSNIVYTPTDPNGRQKLHRSTCTSRQTLCLHNISLDIKNILIHSFDPNLTADAQADLGLFCSPLFHWHIFAYDSELFMNMGIVCLDTFFLENKSRHFMWISLLGSQLHEISRLIFYKE